MKNLLFVILILGYVCSAGCSSDQTSATEEKNLRQQFAKKNFDIKDVPPNERAMVQGYMDRAKKMAAEGKSPGVGH